MKITFNPNILMTPQLKSDKKASKQNPESFEYSYNPIAYRDYNINFGARLNRSPENFYEQDFNKQNMPDAMKKYLAADYEDRKNIPPAQMMKIVYGDLESINKLDFVPRVFLDEPLFADLTDSPNRKAKKGIVSEVGTLKSEMDAEPLFKDGTSNFGMYLLRKIYLEGKTLKEINKDFKADMSDTYKGLITSEIDYDTFSAYGIKFPKNSFWRSFIVTRPEYPYEYKPRKAIESRLPNTIQAEKFERRRKPKYEGVKPNEIDDVARDIMKSGGNSTAAVKELRRRSSEANSFVAKYLSEIMSVTMERLHMSPEMKYFFEHYKDVSNSQRKKLKQYWNQPNVRENMSYVMKATIRMFMEAYDEDGNNEVFQDLLEYANDIKSQRETQQAKHDLMEEIYNAYLADNPDIEALTPPTPGIIPASDISSKNPGESETMKTFEFTDPEGGVHKYTIDVDKDFARVLNEEYKLAPAAFRNFLLNYFMNSELCTDKYKANAVLLQRVPDSLLPQIMSEGACQSVAQSINKAFSAKYPKTVAAVEQAIMDMMLTRMENKDYSMFQLLAEQLLEKASDELMITEWTPAEKLKLEELYKYYKTPIQNKKDLKKVADLFIKTSSSLPENFEDYKLDPVNNLFRANLEKYPNLKKEFIKKLSESNFISNCGGTLKVLLASDLPEAMLQYKCDRLLTDFLDSDLENKNGVMSFYESVLILDKENIMRYLSKEPKLMLSLLAQHEYRRK